MYKSFFDYYLFKFKFSSVELYTMSLSDNSIYYRVLFLAMLKYRLSIISNFSRSTYIGASDSPNSTRLCDSCRRNFHSQEKLNWIHEWQYIPSRVRVQSVQNQTYHSTRFRYVHQQICQINFDQISRPLFKFMFLFRSCSMIFTSTIANKIWFYFFTSQISFLIFQKIIPKRN